MTQLPMFAPGSGGHETVTLPQLHARRDDPATSKAAAAKLQRKAISKSLALFLATLGAESLTVKEIAEKTINPDFWNWEFAKRTKAWCVAGHIEATGAVRGGGMVYRRR